MNHITPETPDGEPEFTPVLFFFPTQDCVKPGRRFRVFIRQHMSVDTRGDFAQVRNNMVFGLTQAALAAKIGVETKTVSQWESDRRRPDAANLRRICCALDVSGDYLLGLIYKQPQRLPSGVEVGALMGWWSEEAIRKSDGWSWEMWQKRLEKAYEEKRQKAKELGSGEDVLDLVILACKESNVPYPLPLPLTKLLDKIQMWQKFRGWSDGYEMIEALGYFPGYEGKEEAKFVHHQDWSSLLYRGPKHMSVNQYTNAMLERMAEMMGITLRGLLDDDIPPPEEWKI